MASIRYSATGGEIKGKINGTVYQGGKSGPIVKRLLHRSFVRIAALIFGALASTYTWADSQASNAANPPNFMYPDGSHVANGKFSGQRAILSDMAASWKSLTSAQRAAWNAAAVNFPFKNKFGDQYTASGFQVYLQLNMNMVITNQEANVFPPFPSLPVLPEITPPNGDTDDPLLYTFPAGIPADQNILVYSSVGQSAGRQIKAKNQKLIGILPAGMAAGTVNLRYMWQLFFGMLQANSAIQVRFVPVSKVSGEAGAANTVTELIDVITAGARLTKSDAIIQFGNRVAPGSYDLPFWFETWNVPFACTLGFTGAQAASFEFSINGGLDWVTTMDIEPNQWDNSGRISLLIRANITSGGNYNAALEILLPDYSILGTTPIEAVGV